MAACTTDRPGSLRDNFERFISMLEAGSMSSEAYKAFLRAIRAQISSAELSATHCLDLQDYLIERINADLALAQHHRDTSYDDLMMVAGAGRPIVHADQHGRVPRADGQSDADGAHDPRVVRFPIIPRDRARRPVPPTTTPPTVA